ncbi:MAG: hypothetical protein AAGD07_12290 [Planctomycetota bacterium]
MSAFLVALFLGVTCSLPCTAALAQSMDDEFDEEMMEDEEFDGDGPRRPAGPQLATTGPTPWSLLSALQPDWSPLAKRVRDVFTAPPPQGPPPAVGPKLYLESQVAYRYGNLPLAMDLYFGHIARGGDRAASQRDEVLFSPLFRRPIWRTNLGVSFALRGDEVSPGERNPITDSGTKGGGNQRGGFNDFDGFDEGMDEMMEDEMEMEMEEMEMEMEMEMEEMEMGDPGGRRERFGGPPGGRRQPAPPPEPKLLKEDTVATLEQTLGLAVERVRDGLLQRLKSGKFGRALSSVPENDPSNMHRIGGFEATGNEDLPMVMPGVVFVGEGQSRDTAIKANKANLDLLFHYDVSLTSYPNGDVKNISRLRVVNCKTGKNLILSGAMDNSELLRLQRSGRGDPSSYINEQLETVWTIIDNRVTATPLPDLSPEIARKRVTQLLSDNLMSPLRKLAEVRLYGGRGWLTPEQVEEAFVIIAGNDAMTILHGADSVAFDVVRRMAVAGSS